MCKPKTYLSSWLNFVSATVLLGLLAAVKPDAALAQCNPGIGDSIGVVGPYANNYIHVGQNATVQQLILFNGSFSVGGMQQICTATNVKTWLVYPDNTFQTVLNLNLQSAPNNTLIPGSAVTCPGDGSCLGFSSTYTVQSSDIAQGLSFTTNWPPSLGTTTISASGQPNTVLFQYAGAASMVGNSTAKGTAGQSLGLTVLQPCVSITKLCNGGPFPYNTPIAFSGVISNCSVLQANPPDGTLYIVSVSDNPTATITFATTTALGNSFPASGAGGSLVQGDSVSYTGSYLPTNNLCGPFTDTVQVVGADLTGYTVTNSASATCTVITAPCISVTKTCPSTIAYGTTSYTVSGVVTNCGNVPLNGVTVVDAGNFTNSLGTIAVGGSAPYSDSITVPVGCGPFTDTVVAQGADACSGTVVTNDASCTTTVTTAPCISVTKTCPSSIVYGTTSYTVSGVVTNCGNVPLNGVTVVDAGNFTNSLGTIAVGGSAPYSDSITVPVGCGPFTDTVVAQGADACNGTVVTNDASCTTTVTTAPCISVTKTCPSSIAYGTTSYTVSGVVTNCGNVPLNGVTVVDLGNFTNNLGTIAVGGSAPYSHSITVPVGCGPFTDTVVAQGADACGGTLVTNDASCTTTVTTAPCISVTKTCPSSIVYGTTSYTVSGVVTNCGNVPLNDVTVVDLGNFTNNLGTIAVGGSAPYSHSITVPVGCGPFTDTVVAQGADACGGTLVTNDASCTTTVTTAPCISVTKTCPSSIAYGTTSYTVSGVVTNCGNVPLNDVTVVDLGNFTNNLGTIAVGGSAPYSHSITVPVGCGPFTDTVVAQGADACGGTVVTNDASCTTTVTTAPCISVTKTCPSSIVYGTTSYTVSGVVTNCGNVPLNGVTVVDAGNFTNSLGTIAVGGSAPYSDSITVPVGCGPWTDTVVAQGADACGGTVVTNDASCTTTVTTAPCISVTKTCPSSIAYGTTSYTVSGVVTNCGNVPLNDVTVVDAGNFTNSLGTIAVGGSAPYSDSITVPVGCGPFTDTVVAQGADACGGTVVTNDASCTTTVNSAPCIGVTKTCPSSIAYGTTSYTVSGVVTNCGNVPLTDVIVVDAGNFTNSLGTIAAGGSAPYSDSITVPVGCGPFTDTVVAQAADACNGGLITNSASCTTTVTTAPCISVTKTCPSSIAYGTTSYTVSGVVTNCGNVPLNGVTVVDAGNFTNDLGTIAVGGSAPYSDTIQVPVGCGPFTDTVVAQGADACGGTLVTNDASCTTMVTTAPCISVTKTCPSSIVYGTTSYTVSGVVTNCGNVPLNGVTVVDAGNFTNSLGTIAVGGSAPYSDSITVPVGCGPFTDTVVAQGADACGGTLVTNDASCTTTVTTAPCISVTKTCPSSIAYGTTSYTVSGVVTNCGNVPLNGVTVVDAGNFTNSLGTIAVGGSAPYSDSITVPVGCGPFTDTVVAQGADACSGTVVTNDASCTTTVTTAPCISVTKTCPSSIVYGTTSYTVSGVVTNCGNVPLNGVTVVDAGNFTNSLGTIAVGGSAPYSDSITVPVGCGPWTDTVVAQGADACSGTVVTNDASCTTTVTTAPCISVTKTCPSSIAYGTTSYTVSGVVTNCGNVPLNGVTVVDAGNFTNSLGTIAVGGSAPYSDSITVPVGCGPFTDTVVAQGADACNGTVVTNDASCTTTVTTAPCISVTKTCPGTLAYGTTGYVVSGVVANCGNVPLNNVQVVDDNGTPGVSSDDITVTIPGGLPVGGSAPWQATNTLPAGFFGSITDTVVASGNDACTGALVTNNAHCTTTIVPPPPKICVTKGIICGPIGTPVPLCSLTNNYLKVDTGVNGATFCYRIIVSNCGALTLTNVVVTDTQLGTLSDFPTTLLPGQTATNTYSKSYAGVPGGPTTNINLVTARGTANGVTTNAMDTATAIVVPVGVQCGIILYSSFNLDTVSNDNHVTLPSGTTNTPVEFILTVCNTGDADLDVSLTNLPPLFTDGTLSILLGVPGTTNIPAQGCITIDGWMEVGCPGLTNLVTVQGTAVGTAAIPCIYNSQGNAVTTEASSCSAIVVCAPAVSCRVTGGGTLYAGDVSSNCINVITTLYDDLDSNLVDHISHGGQLGAPFSQMDCATRLDNPCIRGEWEHVRHYDNKQNGAQDDFDMDFHSANPNPTGHFDTLECGCLPCCYNGTNYVGNDPAPPGWSNFKFKVCNPDDRRICGPLPSPAPANAIIFSGIGTFTPQSSVGNGKNSEKRYVVFRVYIEDRSEPGGIHPGGAKMPGTVYCFQAWDTGIPIMKKPDFSAVAVDFRTALGQDSCAFMAAMQNESLLPGSLPSKTVDGVAADVADQGALHDGSQQIHPSTGATCTQ